METPKSAATSGSSPIMTNSVVPMPKAPIASASSAAGTVTSASSAPRRSSHAALDAPLDQQPVGRIGGDETDDHSDLHHEPEHDRARHRFLVQQPESCGSHPAEHPDLEGDERKGIGLDRV